MTITTLDDIRKDMALTVQVLLLNGKEDEAKQYLKPDVKPDTVEYRILKAVRPLMRDGSFVQGLDDDFPARCFFGYLRKDKIVEAEAILHKGKTIEDVQVAMLNAVKDMLRDDFYFADRFLNALGNDDKEVLHKLLLENETVEQRALAILNMYLWTNEKIDEDHALKQIQRAYQYGSDFSIVRGDMERDLLSYVIEKKRHKIFAWLLDETNVLKAGSKRCLNEAIKAIDLMAIEMLAEHRDCSVEDTHVRSARLVSMRLQERGKIHRVYYRMNKSGRSITGENRSPAEIKKHAEAAEQRWNKYRRDCANSKKIIEILQKKQKYGLRRFMARSPK